MAAPSNPWPEILHLLPAKITFKGQPVNGDEQTLKGFAGWLMQNLPGVVGDGDAEHKAGCLLLWLRSESRYEADQATRMTQQAQVQQAPVNPISTQTVPQMAQMAPPVPQPVSAAPVAPNAEGEAEAESGPGMICPECQTKISGVRGFKRHVTMTHKVDWSAFCLKHGLDQKTALAGAAPAAVPTVAAAVPPPPQAQPVPPMFQASGPAQPFVAPAPPPPPASMPAPAGIVASPQIPMTGMAVPPQPTPTHAPGPMVAFDPNTIKPGLPGQQAVPFTPPMQPMPQAAPAHTVPIPPTTTPNAPSVLSSAGPSREDLAKMLGGPIDLIVVRLLDAAAVNLTGRVDVNQIAALAESRAKSEMKVADLAQASYGAGKQAAQRHFGDMLNQAPGCYLLLNGYEPILPSGYLEILAARVTKFHMVTDGGRQTTTIF
jgi:hypothetical protein